VSLRRRALLLLGVGAVAAAAAWGYRAMTGLPDLQRWDAAVDAAAREFAVDANLLRGLIAAESSGDPDAVSRAGAIGLMQLMPATAREEAERLRIEDYADERLTDGALNVRLGAAYLARLLKRYGGEEPYALAAYNAGPTRVSRWRTAAPGLAPREVIAREGFEETRAHMERVLRFRDAYRARYADR